MRKVVKILKEKLENEPEKWSTDLAGYILMYKRVQLWVCHGKTYLQIHSPYDLSLTWNERRILYPLVREISEKLKNKNIIRAEKMIIEELLK